MKKVIILILFLGIGIYFFLFQKPKSPEIVEEAEIIPQKKKVVPPPPVANFLPEEEKPLQNPYLDSNFKPIDPPAGNLNIKNKINPDLVTLIKKQLQNPELPEMTVELKTQGTYILVKENLGRFVEQILITINSPGENSRSFNAYADAETGEIVHTIEPNQATYSIEEIDTVETETPSGEKNMEDFSEPPPDEEMTFPVD